MIRDVRSLMILSVPSSCRHTRLRIGSSCSSRYEYGSSLRARSCSFDGAAEGDDSGTDLKHFSIVCIRASQFSCIVEIRPSHDLESIDLWRTLRVSSVEEGSNRAGRMRLFMFCVTVSSTSVLDSLRKSLRAVISSQIEVITVGYGGWQNGSRFGIYIHRSQT